MLLRQLLEPWQLYFPSPPLHTQVDWLQMDATTIARMAVAIVTERSQHPNPVSLCDQVMFITRIATLFGRPEPIQFTAANLDMRAI